jgi:hypothetical protein
MKSGDTEEHRVDQQSYQFAEVATVPLDWGLKLRASGDVQDYECKGFPDSVREQDWGCPFHPQIGRNTLIFWNCERHFGNGNSTQTIQHKLLMPHPSECGREKAT